MKNVEIIEAKQAANLAAEAQHNTYSKELDDAVALINSKIKEACGKMQTKVHVILTRNNIAHDIMSIFAYQNFLVKQENLNAWSNDKQEWGIQLSFDWSHVKSNFDSECDCESDEEHSVEGAIEFIEAVIENDKRLKKEMRSTSLEGLSQDDIDEVLKAYARQDVFFSNSSKVLYIAN